MTFLFQLDGADDIPHLLPEEALYVFQCEYYDQNSKPLPCTPARGRSQAFSGINAVLIMRKSFREVSVCEAPDNHISEYAITFQGPVQEPSVLEKGFQNPRELTQEEELAFSSALSTYTYSKVGGYPTWLQVAEVPACPKCGEAMLFICQMHSHPGHINYADSGIGYVFRCCHCGLGATLAQG